MLSSSFRVTSVALFLLACLPTARAAEITFYDWMPYSSNLVLSKGDKVIVESLLRRMEVNYLRDTNKHLSDIKLLRDLRFVIGNNEGRILTGPSGRFIEVMADVDVMRDSMRSITFVR